ncbi:MAG: hypothetical protein EOM05_00315 [Clostridia bacterium]|nr:hypothetical protein [Clostridia bacterium]
MSELLLKDNMCLKLNNVLCVNVDKEELIYVDKIVDKMGNFIVANGYKAIGPLVQYTSTKTNDSGEADILFRFMRQSSGYVHKIEKPYRIESQIKVANCMYCRYIGTEDKLRFAYDKINLTAFENDISLNGDSYTVFVDCNEDDGTIIADVFMQRAEKEN